MAGNKMYTSSQIAAGALFGTALTGAAMMRANFLVMSDVSRARNVIYLGIVATIATLVAASVVPLRFPSSVFLLMSTALLELYARRVGMHKRVLIEKSIPLMSNWRVVGLSIAGLVIAYSLLGIGIFWFFIVKRAMTSV